MQEPRIAAVDFTVEDTPPTPGSFCTVITRTRWVRVIYDDASVEDLFQMVPGVESYSEDDLLGLTKDQALQLHEELVCSEYLLDEVLPA